MTAGSAGTSAGRRGLLLAAFIATTLSGCRAGGGVMTPGDATALPAATEASGLAGATVAAAGTPASGVQLSFIDHASFRKLDPDSEVLAADLAAVERNLDAARQLGASSYVLFTGDLEKLLSYDFAVPGIGAVGAQAFPPDDPWRSDAAGYRQALGAAIAAGRTRGIDLLVHSNQFSYPDAVFAVVAPAIADAEGHVCVDRAATWLLYRAKLGELFDALPGLAGLQLTADEAEQSLFGCALVGAPIGAPGEGGEVGAADGSTLARVNRLVAETAAVAADHGLRVEARTWGRLYRLEREADPARMFDDLPANARLSLKYTAGDFHLFSPPSPLLAYVDQRAVLELDAWGEHLGFNAFPCWLGPVWAPVIRDALQRGVNHLSVRISWDNHANPIFGRPWGNVVNVDLARAMAEDRDLDADAFLRQWVDARYGPAGRDAALRLYRRSTALQAVWLAEGDVELTDHSRLFRPYQGLDGDLFERVRDRLDRLQEAGGFRTAGDFDARRGRVDAACAEADGLVLALESTGAAPPGWTAELARGARAQCRVARGAADQLALLFWRREAAAGRPTPGLAALEARIRAWTADWQAEDAESFALLEGGAGLAMVEGF